MRRAIAPGLVIVGVLVVWQAATYIFGLKPYFIPSPVNVVDTLVKRFGTIYSNAIPTIIESVCGFALGNVIAILLAILFVHVRTTRQAIYPLTIVLQSVPIVAIAPVFIVLMGTGSSPKIVMTAIITFFPTLVNAVRGLESVPPASFELLQTVDSSTWQILRKLRWPTALPQIFVGLRIAASASVIGAIIAEWAGANSGLGYLIISSTYQFDTPLLWATLVASSLLVLIAFGLVALAERIFTPWQYLPGAASDGPNS
jgi:NitT/TauT family transport system permease protein